MAMVILAVAALIAGVQNALAGGGSFLTFPALLLSGLNPLMANVTSTVALFPGQITTGWAGRRAVSGLPGLGFGSLFALSVLGGALGALLLLATPVSIFSALVPWLVLAATLIFAWGSFFRRPGGAARRLGPAAAGAAQLGIAVYGGYFGGGIGILMLAALTLAGLEVRRAAATKNVLAAAMNGAAVLLFVWSHEVAWQQTGVIAVASAAGGWLGASMLHRVNERALRVGIVLIGLALAVGLFLRHGTG